MAKDDIMDAEGDAGPKTDSFMTGMVVFTTVALLAGFIVIELALKNNYGRGMLS